MTKFLFTVWPFLGCVHPGIAVAHALSAHGHEVAFYTGASAHAPVRKEGFVHFPFRPFLERQVESLVLSRDAIGVNWRRPWKLRPRLRAFFLDTVPQQLADLDAIIAEWAPDVIVCDPAMWGPFLILHETQHVPVALLSYVCGCMLPGPDAPPLGLGLPLPRNRYTRLRNRLIGAIMDLFMMDVRCAASALRKRYGLSALDGPVIALAGQLPLYLVPSCPEFDYQRRDLPPSVHYVGPLQWYPPQEPPPWLDKLPQNQPWVHVTEGTLHVQDPFVLRAAAQGLANLSMQVIMTTGGNRDPAELDLGPTGPNVRVESWVNHRDLLPRTDVLVTTAGGGTVMAALDAGVPMVVVLTEWDKAENAQRVVEARAGVRLSSRQCTPSRLREAVRRVLHDPSYRQNAEQLATSLHQYGGPAQAAALLEGIV